MPFRDAHAVVGSVVRQSLDDGTPMADLVRAHPDLGEDAAALLEPGVSVTRRTTPGGAGPGPVATPADRFRSRLADTRARRPSLALPPPHPPPPPRGVHPPGRVHPPPPPHLPPT